MTINGINNDRAIDPEPPSNAEAPNARTAQAIAQLEAGKGRSFSSAAALMADVNADD